MKMTLKLLPRRTPEPKRPFVNRKRELKLVQDKLDIGIQRKPMPSVVTCFWGAFGMGKSWLLIELERIHKCDSSQVHSTSPTIAARLDLDRVFGSALWQDDHFNRKQLIREIWRQLASQVGDELPDFERASANEWVEAFVNKVTAWATNFGIPIIMLDTVDDLIVYDEETFFWLEEHLVEQLAITDQVLFVFASRGELQHWKRFQVRRRVDSHRLTSFDAQTAGEEVGVKRDVSEVLYRSAFGHPLVTEYLGTALEEEGVNIQSVESVEKFIEPKLVQTVLKEVIEEILKAVPELSARLAREASVLRWISVEPLRSLARALDLVEPGYGDAYYLELIEGLQANHLLYWNSTQNCYEFDPVLRRLLAHFLKLDGPLRFCAAHLNAFTFHCNHLNQYPQYLARYVPELAYHRTMLGRCEPLEPLPPTLQSWWEQFLSDKAPANPERWAEVVTALKRDEELRDVLPAEDYQHLYSEAQKRASKAAS